MITPLYVFSAHKQQRRYDDTQITAKVPSQELNDAMVKAFKDKIKE